MCINASSVEEDVIWRSLSKPKWKARFVWNTHAVSAKQEQKIIVRKEENQNEIQSVQT